MALASEIRVLRDRATSALAAAHDYYTDTIAGWAAVRRFVAAGERFRYRNPATGTLTTESDLVAKSDDYVSVQLNQATFQNFIAIFEGFFFDFLRLWLTTYPQSLGFKKLDFKTVLDAPDKDAVTQQVVGRELNEVLYERPAAWFAYLEEKAKLGGPTPDEIGRFAEAKATRDVFVHNAGVATKSYEAKAGPFARYAAGEFVEIQDAYHRETWALLLKIVAAVSDAALAKSP